MKVPGIIHIKENPITDCKVEINGSWVAARPEPFYSKWQRFKAAWLVFTGKADALKWHKQ